MFPNEQIGTVSRSLIFPIMLPNERSPFAFPPQSTYRKIPNFSRNNKSNTVFARSQPEAVATAATQPKQPSLISPANQPLAPATRFGQSRQPSRSTPSPTNNEMQGAGFAEQRDILELSPRSQQKLSDQEKREIERLRQIDRKVRAHEAAHQAAAGSLVRGKSFRYERGPDGKQYAVAGEVRIDTSPVSGDPEATIRKMQQVQRAALAPADPSPQDRSVAAQAQRQEMRARQDLMNQRRVQQRGDQDNEHIQQAASSARSFGPKAPFPSSPASRSVPPSADRQPSTADRAESFFTPSSVQPSSPYRQQPTLRPTFRQSLIHRYRNAVPSTPFAAKTPTDPDFASAPSSPGAPPPGAIGTIFDRYM